jgi:uncharacterized protein YacL
MDDKTKTGTPDRKLINVHENYEVEYWTKEFNINKEALLDAVLAVGNSVAAVKKYLQK